jgi:hypothetical protein
MKVVDVREGPLGKNGSESFMRLHRFSITSLTLTGLALSASFALAGMAVSSGPAAAVVYCQYVDYPHGCIVRAGVVLRPRPVARAAAREAVRPGTPMNRGGPVNRVGRR